MVDKRRYKCRVVRFNQDSEVRQIIQYDRHRKSLYFSGISNKFIKENKNGDICLANCEVRAVMVTNIAGDSDLDITEQPRLKRVVSSVQLELQLTVWLTSLPLIPYRFI